MTIIFDSPLLLRFMVCVRPAPLICASSAGVEPPRAALDCSLGVSRNYLGFPRLIPTSDIARPKYFSTTRRLVFYRWSWITRLNAARDFPRLAKSSFSLFYNARSSYVNQQNTPESHRAIVVSLPKDKRLHSATSLLHTNINHKRK